MKCFICDKSFKNKRNPNAKTCSRSCNAKLSGQIRVERLLKAKAGRKCQICEKELTHRQIKYCSVECARKSMWGSSNPMWKGGTKKHPEGYVYRYCPDHPNNTDGYVLEHRLVMEGLLNRRLSREEVVHHINGDKSDNRPANLEVLASHRDHLIDHHISMDGWFGRYKESLSSQDKKAVNSVEPSKETIPSQQE